jgi:predicted nucleotidyltransferase
LICDLCLIVNRNGDNILMVSDVRTAEVEDLLARAAQWAARHSDIRALVLVGSWARGVPRPDSDVDLIVLTDDVERYLDGDDLLQGLGAVQVVREYNWGAIEERRLLLPSGLEVEVGIGRPSWASSGPIDEGTRQVVTAGARALHDPDGIVAALMRACAPGNERSQEPTNE